ncbi:apolipoprotein N-acyltransferase [Glaciihabitans arcticus]|uniref:Apolipoprotein N-acyltransferase n=1 Tax=Glaciihabitans arcticus TaxID=2668039 RepID=A0A4V2JER7_9MICO|nr:apolipoprotein N-acyltransferase [Glaciihabitans arcticus]TBN56599.1 apolipoprotein N-acyltransferase [Glaciihabitans arcticus]
MPDAVTLPKPLLPLWGAILVALGAGPVLDDGFPDGNLWPLTLVGIALVLVTLVGRSAWGSLLVGLVGGLSFYLVHIEWAALFLGLVPMTALATLESLFFSVGALLITLAYRWLPLLWSGAAGRLGMLPLAIAGLWTAREAIASVWPYGGFAWGRVSLSQSQSPLADLFSWVGVSGVSFLMVWVVALAVEAVRFGDAPRLLRCTLAVGAASLVLIVPVLPPATDGTLRVLAVQGNGKAGYFDERQQGDLLQAQLDATAPFIGEDVDVVVWPESGTDIDPLRSAAVARALDQVSESFDAPLVTGVIQARGEQIFNSSVVWNAGEGIGDTYDKRHPVPFGEYVPDRAFWRPFAPDLIDLIGRDYTPGTSDAVVDLGGVIAGLNICFDIVDDQLMTETVRDGAQLVFAQSNNADFGAVRAGVQYFTDESVQQLAIARIRALELGRSVVVISTVGTSEIIGPDGVTLDSLPIYTPGGMVTEVPLSSAVTPAVALGRGIEWLVSGFGLAALLVAGAASRRRRAA